MKHIAISFFISLGLLVTSLQAADTLPTKDKLHIYLLIGQSNMAGRAKLEEGDDKPIARCFLLNGEDKWEKATNPLNRYSTIRKGNGNATARPRLWIRKINDESRPS